MGKSLPTQFTKQRGLVGIAQIVKEGEKKTGTHLFASHHHHVCDRSVLAEILFELLLQQPIGQVADIDNSLLPLEKVNDKMFSV